MSHVQPHTHAKDIFWGEPIMSVGYILVGYISVGYISVGHILLGNVTAEGPGTFFAFGMYLSGIIRNVNWAGRNFGQRCAVLMLACQASKAGLASQPASRSARKPASKAQPHLK